MKRASIVRLPDTPLEWARWGQQKRLDADFRSAGKAFARARAGMESCSPVEQCEIVSLKVSFLLERMQPRDALLLVTHGEAIARDSWGAVLALQRGLALADLGRYRDAAKSASAAYWLCKAAGRADWSGMAILNILFAFARDGRAADAREFLAATEGQLVADLPALAPTRIGWLRGLLLMAEGRPHLAVSALEEVRADLAASGKRFCVADVLIDIAEGLSRIGDHRRLWSVAHAMRELFGEMGVPEGVTLATELLVGAASRLEASVESVARIRKERAA